MHQGVFCWLTLLSILYSSLLPEIVSGGCGILTDRTGNTGTLESPNYPSDYDPNLFCEWKISLADTAKVIILDIKDMDIHKGSTGICSLADYLRIENADVASDVWADYLCGNTTQTITATYHSARVKFKTTGFDHGRGFQIEWSATAKSSTTEKTKSNNNSTIYIIVGVISGIGLIIGIIVFIGRFMISQKGNRTRDVEPTHTSAEKAWQTQQSEEKAARVKGSAQTSYTGTAATWTPGTDIAPAPKGGDNLNDKAKPQEKKALPHIMISYQWDVKPEVLEFRERLRDAGYRVWIDVEQMHKGTSTFDSMAKAVDNAAIVIPVLTQKYQESINCRKEVEFADKKNKTLVPIRMETGYATAAWLDFLLGGNTEFNFYDEDVYEEELKKVLHTIESTGSAAKVENYLFIDTS